VRVSYCGVVRPAEVQAVFALYDAFILPTLGENFGHAIGESLSAGCPVLCSQLTPWTEVLNGGGGAALTGLEASAWSAEISRRAAQSPHQRDDAKRAAIKAYVRWRRGVETRSAVEVALHGLPQTFPGVPGADPRP